MCDAYFYRELYFQLTLMILFGGDPHGDFRPVVRAVKMYSPQAIVLLGDFDLARSLEDELAAILDKTEVWFIHGNHDADQDCWYDRLFSSKLAHRNLHGRVVKIAGMRVAGLGGVFRAKIWRPPAAPKFPSHHDLLSICGKGERWRSGIPRKHHASIFWQHYKALWHQQADILVTHEAPSCHRYGFKEIDDLAEALGVKAVFHGHHHEQYTKSIVNGKILVHGVAKAGISDQAGKVLIPGQSDTSKLRIKN